MKNALLLKSSLFFTPHQFAFKRVGSKYPVLCACAIRSMVDSTMCLVGHASDACCILLFKFAYLISSSNWQCFRIKALCQVPHRKHTKGNGQNSGGREALKSRGKGTTREALLEGDKIEWYRGSHP